LKLYSIVMLARVLPIVLVGAAACGSAAQYQFVADPSTTAVGGGQVRVLSDGLSPVRGGGNVIPAIHVRMVVDNNAGAQPLSVNFDDARLWVPGLGSVAPMFNGGTVNVAPGETKHLDFYFTPPGIVNSDAGMPRYKFSWIVHTPESAFGTTTQFARGPAPA
jgi:hypothetical protein